MLRDSPARCEATGLWRVGDSPGCAPLRHWPVIHLSRSTGQATSRLGSEQTYLGTVLFRSAGQPHPVQASLSSRLHVARDQLAAVRHVACLDIECSSASLKQKNSNAALRPA